VKGQRIKDKDVGSEVGGWKALRPGGLEAGRPESWKGENRDTDQHGCTRILKNIFEALIFYTLV
jgi:hypothetical protein